MITYNIDRYRQLEARAEQLSAAVKEASDSYREAALELRQRELRLEKATPGAVSSRYPDPGHDLELTALERDVDAARKIFEQHDAQRIKAGARWTAAGRLFRACKDYLLEHGVADPDSRHDETRASGLAPAGSGIGER